jgi:hypothetical protein
MKSTNVFLLDTSELDLNKTDGRPSGLKGQEYADLPSFGEVEAWFLFECPVSIEYHGIDAVKEAACEAFDLPLDVMEPLVYLVVHKLQASPDPNQINPMFRSLVGLKGDK